MNRANTRAAIGFALLCALVPGSRVAAQDQLGISAGARNEIVVTAGRSGAPMWSFDTPGGAVILVGEIKEVPKSTPWFPDRLEQAARGSQRVILGIKPKISPGDIFRLIFAGGKLTKLPKGTAAADFLSAQQNARLTALEARYDKDYSHRSFLLTSFDLLSRRLGLTKDTGKDASEVVKKTARKADIPTEPVGTVRGEDLLDSLADAPPESHVPCLDAAMAATEEGAALVEQRGQDWRSSNVPAVMENPIEIALGRCWPWTDTRVAGDLRGPWIDAIEAAADGDGVTLAVVPLRTLAEPGGILDTLDNRGIVLRGPVWRR